MGGEKSGIDQIRLRADARDSQWHRRNVSGNVLLSRRGARSRPTQKGLRAVHAYRPLRPCDAREKPCGKTGTAPQVERKPWTLSHGFGDEGLTGRIEDLRDH